MKLAFLLPCLHFGGVERWALSLAASFKHIETIAFVNGGAVSHPVIEAEARRIAPVHEFKFQRKDGKLSSDLLDSKDVLNAACRAADVILTTSTGMLGKVAVDLNCAKVLVAHSDPSWEGQKHLLDQDAPHATHLAAVSGAAARCFTRKATIIPNGADAARVTPAIGRNEQRRAWGISHKAKVALYLGRFGPIKNQEKLLEAMHFLPPEWKAVFVGCAGSPADLSHMVNAAQQEHPGRCVFVAEANPHVGDALAAADCLVIPSLAEAAPLVWFEAMLASLPVVTTDYAFVQELHAKHGALATVVAQDAHPEEMAAAIKDSQQHYSRVIEAREVAWQNYTAAGMGQRWEKYLLENVTRWQSRRWKKRQARPVGKREEPEAWPKPRGGDKLKVCFVTAYPQAFGGVEEWFATLVRSTPEIEWSISCHRCQLDSLSIPFLQRLERLGCRHSVDNMRSAHGADIALTWGVPQARRLLEGFPGKTVLISHGSGEWSKRFVAPFETIADKCVAVSENAADVFRGAAEIVPNGLDCQRSTPQVERDRFRSMIGLRPSDVAVGFVGRLSAEKNPLAVAQGVSLLGPPFRAVYFGMDSRSGDYPKQIQALCRDAILRPSYHQIGDVFQALDCLVVASHEEGFSLVTIEAMYGECPVVTTPVGIILDMEREYGQLSVPLPLNPTPQQVADGILAAVRPERRAFIAKAKGVVSEQYTDEHMARRWEKLFCECLAIPEAATIS